MPEQQSNIDYDLESGDCWHLDAPHYVTIRLKTGNAEKIIGRYRRVGINAREASKTTKGKGVRVVIFDTGVEVEHPSLKENIDTGAARDFDHSVNGEGRPIRSGSKASASEGERPYELAQMAQRWAEAGRIDNKHDAHGTACAGIVGAREPTDSPDKGSVTEQKAGDAHEPMDPPAEGSLSDPKVVGVAPECTLVPIRLSTNFEIDALVKALEYAKTAGDVILLPRFLAWPDEMAEALELKIKEPSKWEQGWRKLRDLRDLAEEPSKKAEEPSKWKEELGRLDEVLRNLAKEEPSEPEQEFRKLDEAVRDLAEKNEPSERKRALRKLDKVLRDLAKEKPSEREQELRRLDEALRDLAERKPVVCAAGNDGSDQLIYPANLEEVIAVGACNEKGYRSTYSQHGEGLDVVAPSNDVPNEDRDLVRLDEEEVERRMREEHDQESRRRGTPTRTGWERIGREKLVEASNRKGWNLDRLGVLAIATTDNLGPFGYNIEPAGDYCRPFGNYGFGGTSAAAAQVAGVVALMLSARLAAKKSFADLDPGTIKAILCRTTKKLEDGLLHPEGPRGKPLPDEDVAARQHPEAPRKQLKPDEVAARQQRFTEEFGAGLVDAYAAVEAAMK